MEEHSVCDDCPMRLYNSKQYNLQGIGNPFSGRCIVIPNVDYTAYKKGSLDFSTQIEIIKSIISSTGELDNLYILPLIRCNEKIACEINDDIYNRCIQYFAKDLVLYDFKDILLLGDAGRRFFKCELTKYLDTIIISPNHRRYVVNYAPFIKYIDDNKFDIFKNHLLKWYNSSLNNDFTNYEVLRL